MMNYTRIYSGQKLKISQSLTLDQEPSNHLTQVLRKKEGSLVEIFDGRGASFIAEIVSLEKKEVKANLARKPQGNDRSQVKAIAEGLCDLALGNTYYMGKMLENPKQRTWAASAGIFFPDQKGVGTHVNLSGAGITKYAKNKENAIKLIEFLSGDLAQHMYAQVNHEYPLKKNVNLSLIVQSFGKMQEGITKGSFKQDLVSLPKLGNLREKAIKVMQRAGFN